MLVLLIPGVGMGGTAVVGPGFVPGLPGDFTGTATQPAELLERGGCKGKKRKPAEPPERGQAKGGRRNRFGGESHR